VDLIWRPALAVFHGFRLEKQAGKWVAIEHHTGEELIKSEPGL
jgi:hypothetical protein